jgi:hypothetical protein
VVQSSDVTSSELQSQSPSPSAEPRGHPVRPGRWHSTCAGERIGRGLAVTLGASYARPMCGYVLHAEAGRVGHPVCLSAGLLPTQCAQS